MQGTFSIFCLGILAVLLLVAAAGDIRHRLIPNWLNGAIALLAIPYWVSLGLDPWPVMAIQIGVALAVFLFFALLFNFGFMGGGDVKMIAAVALWLPPLAILNLLVIMSLAGLALTLAMMAHAFLKKNKAKLQVPYGVAIAFGSAWVLAEPFVNPFV